MTSAVSNTSVSTAQDRKRPLWLQSSLLPLLPLPWIALYFWSGQPGFLALPLLISYIGLPLLDLLMGEDDSNLDEATLSMMQHDPYYQRLAYLSVATLFAMFFVLAWLAGSQDLGWGWIVVLALTCGMNSGLAINTAHELGHKRSPVAQRLALVALSMPFYGHFSVEHNRGHHRDVATPEDPASARMGESIYRFILREVPGAFIRGWESEKIRLARENRGLFSSANQILQSYTLSIVLYAALIAAFGPVMMVFLIIQAVWGWFQLSSANYIEHYGLLREKTASGRYENCKPHHSWNANARASNLVLFQLERHSDHHANPTRGYQCLRHFDDVPQLPTGYFGMYLVAYIPALWYRVMDKRLLAAPHIDGDLGKVNIAPTARNRLQARYG